MNAETAQNETKKTDDPNVQTEDSSEKTEVKSEDKKASEKSVAETVQPNSAAVNNLRVLENIEVKLTVEVGNTEIKIKDDGPGFPKDLIEKHRLGEPYIRSTNQENIEKYGLGLGTFIGKTLLEKNYAEIMFKNSNNNGGAEVVIKWINKDLKLI